MKATKNRWGIRVFSFALICISVAFYILFKYPPIKNSILYQKVIPISGIIFSIISFLAGHFSYPRVHNLKVYLFGYLTGLTGLAYFLFFRLPLRSETGITLLYLMIFINLFILLFVPSYTKYRQTKIITFTIMGVESAWLLFIKYSTINFTFFETIQRGQFLGNSLYFSLFVIAWLSTLLALSVKFMKREFFLGGMISGVALFYAISWFVPLKIAPELTPYAEDILLIFMMFFLDVAMVIHWFSRMEHRISYDPLLKIYNRNYCTKIIDEQSSVRTTPPFGVAMVDIDHFKNVNDTHGHQAGDTILHAVAQVMQNEVIPDGIACRYGGEEIIIFFPGKNSKQMKEPLESVREAIEKTIVPCGKKKLSVTVSIGYSTRETLATSIADVIATADKALYRAKKGGRNQIKSGKCSIKKSKAKK